MEKLTCVDLRLFEGFSFICCFNPGPKEVSFNSRKGFGHSPIERLSLVRTGGRSSKLVKVVDEGILREKFLLLLNFGGKLDGVSASVSKLVSLGNNLLGDLGVGRPPAPPVSSALGFSLVSAGGSSLKFGVHIVIEGLLRAALVIFGVEVSWRGGVSGIV